MDPSRAPIEALKEEMGKVLAAAIDKQGGKVAFAERAGLNRATLYRLLRGGNVSTDVLLRTLRALGRLDLITALIAPPEPSPLELRPATARKRSIGRSRAAQRNPATNRSQATQHGQAIQHSPSGSSQSLVSHLALGRLPGESEDG